MGADGKTPLERIRGRRGRDHMAEFGESILYMPLRGDVADQRRSKINLEPRFLDGIFLGLTDRSDEILVWGPEGVRKARTIRRRPEGEQWNKELLLAVCGTPLLPNPGSEDTRIHTKMHAGVASTHRHSCGATHMPLRQCALRAAAPAKLLRMGSASWP